MDGVKRLGRMILAAYPESRLALSDDLDAGVWARLLSFAGDDELLRAFAAHVRAGNRFAPNAGEIAALCTASGNPPALDRMDQKYLTRVRGWLADRRRLPEGTVDSVGQIAEDGGSNTGEKPSLH